MNPVTCQRCGKEGIPRGEVATFKFLFFRYAMNFLLDDGEHLIIGLEQLFFFSLIKQSRVYFLIFNNEALYLI